MAHDSHEVHVAEDAGLKVGAVAKAARESKDVHHVTCVNPPVVSAQQSGAVRDPDARKCPNAFGVATQNASARREGRVRERELYITRR